MMFGGFDPSTYLKVGIYAALLLIVIFVGMLLIEHGSNSALEEVNKTNEKAATKAEGAALNYDDCRRAGRLWNYGSGKCGGVASSGRN